MPAEFNRLRKENKRLKMEREILKRQRLLHEKNELKYQFIDAEKKSSPIALICVDASIPKCPFYLTGLLKTGWEPQLPARATTKMLLNDHSGVQALCVCGCLAITYL